MWRLTLAMVLVVGCSGDTVKSYPDYQTCFEDLQDKDDTLSNIDAIVDCCLDHPIGGESPACGDTTPDCINFLTNNLAQTSASQSDLNMGCQQYVDERAGSGSGSAR